jgi:hypothetical protein
LVLPFDIEMANPMLLIGRNSSAEAGGPRRSRPLVSAHVFSIGRDAAASHRHHVFITITLIDGE